MVISTDVGRSSSSIDYIVEHEIKGQISKVTSDMKVELKDDLKENVSEMKKEVLKEMGVYRPIEIKVAGKKKIITSVAHEKTETVLNYISARLAVLLVGPAGSGKTHIAVDCADILSLDHYSISVNEQTSKADFLGYTDANGKIVKTNFRKAYEDGGVFIIDEIDAGNPNILTVINSALANDFCPFPDAMVKRHKDFVCVCTANTFGEGESIQYIGRNILDAATKDRFTTIFVEYSPAIESIVLPNYGEFIKKLRTHFTTTGVNMVISTRGGMRLEQIKAAQGKLTEFDVVNNLNLHLEMKKDAKVKQMVDELIAKEKDTKVKKVSAPAVSTVDIEAFDPDEVPF